MAEDLRRLQLARLFELCMRIAAAGAQPPIQTYATLIPASLITELRALLDEMGMIWRE